MFNRILITLLTAFTTSAGATDYILPVFAIRVPGERGSLWTSEVWVTNPGKAPVTVFEGAFIGRTDGAPPCFPIVQPSLVVEPHSTKAWPLGELALGIGCPERAAGALQFSSEGEVLIESRIVNSVGEELPPGMLQGYGQEIRATPLASLATGAQLLPGVAWHRNACGPTEFDTNVFFANPGVSPVSVSLELMDGAGDELLVDGRIVVAPFVFTVSPGEFRQHRIGAADVPLAVCIPPAIGAFVLDTSGSLAVLASVVDRSSGDARTVVPVEARQ